MALADIAARTRQILSGTGLGEKPTIARTADTASASVTNGIVTLTMATDWGEKIGAGDILSKYSLADESKAFVFYVLTVDESTDVVTAINAYQGSPAFATAADLNKQFLEQNPLATGYQIFEAIDVVVTNMLWPEVYDVVTASISAPDITYGTEAVTSEVEEIISAWQIIGSQEVAIDFSRQPWEVHTSVASTGKLAHFRWHNGSTGYYTYRAKLLEADEADTELTYLIALGAAAFLLGGTLPSATLEATKKDNTEAVTQRSAAGDRLWRDFLTLKQQMGSELAKRQPNRIYIDRG